MSKNKIYYLGLLANTDSSILELKLGNNFEIGKISLEDVKASKSIVGDLLHEKKSMKLIVGRQYQG